LTDLLTGTVTFLFTDIEGSTQLLKRLGKSYGEALAEHRKILRTAVQEHGGDEVDRQGDSFLFAFPRADEAAAAAIDGQRALAGHEWPAASQLRVRMGIHTAEPTATEDGYYGLGVHRAARIMAAAHGGQVLVSLATSSLLEDAELQGGRLRDLGEHWLKDLDRPERIFQLDVAGLKSAFPPPRAAGQSPPRAQLPTESAEELLERSDALSTLAGSLAAVAQTGKGRLVLVSGEAGVGKSALLRRFCDDHRGLARILWGACDPLFTPRPLGPLLDVAEVAGGELADVVEVGGRPYAVASALMRELGSRATTVLVLDDLQWADEATLDVVGLLGRRVDALPALVLLSYRDDELDRAHPLRMVLGVLATGPAVRRLEIAPLSRDAIAQLAEPHGADADELFTKTGGNPFFATEALAAGEEELPHTVRDAVLARTARVSPSAAALLDAVAVVPPHVELWLLEALAGDAVDGLDECLASGVLTHAPDGVAFRHELARIAVEESLPPSRRILLHRNALAALADPPTGTPDLERLAHHAEAAGDSRAVLRFAPAAAARAGPRAHREAAAQYAEHWDADGLARREQAELLERYSHECYLTDQLDEALAALKRAIDCHRELGDTRKEGDSLRRLANILWCPGRTAEADKAAHEALAVLERLPPGHELAMALATLSQLRKDLDDFDGAVSWGTRALELAQRLDDTEALCHALNSIGTTELLFGIPSGLGKLERSLELGQRADLAEHVGRAFIHLVWAGTRLHDYVLADRYLGPGLAYSAERGIDCGASTLAFRAVSSRPRMLERSGRIGGLVFEKRCISTFRASWRSSCSASCGHAGEPGAHPARRRARAGGADPRASADCTWPRRGQNGRPQAIAAASPGRRRAPTTLRCGKELRGRSGSSPTGAGARGSRPRFRAERPSHTRSRSPATGRGPQSSGRRSAALRSRPSPRRRR
jgi:class 3 adenylate cyclase/tetratricopeptide (TPR) repeat protein